MKKILGLDLGVSSIGWAVITYPSDGDERKVNILDMGSDIIPYSPNVISEFQKGIGENSTRQRRRYRNSRRFFRGRAKRFSSLEEFLKKNNMLPEHICHDRLSIWALRASAVSERLSLKDLGRVLIHLAHKRGHIYHKDTSVFTPSPCNRQLTISASTTELEVFKDKTIGQYYYTQFLADSNYCIKGQALPRRLHLQEFNRILEFQSSFYPLILTQDNINYLRDQIIFKQDLITSRTSRFRKRITKKCPFESKLILNPGKDVNLLPNNRETVLSTICNTQTNPQMEESKLEVLSNTVTFFNGPKVCHKSNPLYQYYRLWMDLSDICLFHRQTSESRTLTEGEKTILVEYLNKNDYLEFCQIPSLLLLEKSYKIKRLSSSNSSNTTTLNRKRIKGNQTLAVLTSILGKKYLHLLNFSVKIVDKDEKIHVIFDKVTEEPLYILWRDLFAIKDKQILSGVLKSKYGITEKEIISKLCALDFYKSNQFSNVSLKAIKKILPLLIKGDTFENAIKQLGFRYDLENNIAIKQNSKEQNSQPLLSYIKRGQLNNPVVVKIVNKMVSLAKKLMNAYGPFDEIHIEMARDLKMSALQRKKFFLQNIDNENKNDNFAKIIEKHLGVIPSKKMINKLRLWTETEGKCIYCTKVIDMADFILGTDGQIEHIIPRSIQFDNSLNNQICSCNRCNAAKGCLTGYDFMVNKGIDTLNEYIQRVEELTAKRKISYIKRDNLLTQDFELEDGFISSQLKVSQFIARKAVEILSNFGTKIITTKGSVTSYLRHLWDYDDILLELDREIDNSGQSNNPTEPPYDGQYTILTKRSDHRHHSLDALVIALTTGDIISKLDNLSHNRHTPQYCKKFQNHLSENTSLSLCSNNFLIGDHSLDKTLKTSVHPHKDYVKHNIRRIIVCHERESDRVNKSFRSSTNRRKKTLTPKGSLHRETLYGEIKCFRDGLVGTHKVIRQPLEAINTDKISERIVDPVLRELILQRLKQAKEDPQILQTPLFSDKAHHQQIKSVRCLTYHKYLTPLRFDSKGRALCFVRTDNNHHVSLYWLPNGKIVEKVVSFLEYAKLRSLGLNGIVMNPKEQWDKIKREEIKIDELTQECLPSYDSSHIMTLMKDQMYILGLSKETIQLALNKEDYAFLSRHIYKLLAISASNYRFVLHTQAEYKLKDFNKSGGRCVLYCSKTKFLAINPTRIFVDQLGKIKLI